MDKSKTLEFIGQLFAANKTKQTKSKQTNKRQANKQHKQQVLLTAAVVFDDVVVAWTTRATVASS